VVFRRAGTIRLGPSWIDKILKKGQKEKGRESQKGTKRKKHGEKSGGIKREKKELKGRREGRFVRQGAGGKI